MKRYSLLLIAIYFGASMVVAQSRNSLKGPAAKNYKPWKYEQVDKAVYTVDKEDVKGAAAKNQRAGNQELDTSILIPVVFNNPKQGLKGPMAKNYKPWNIEKQTIEIPQQPKKPAGKIIAKNKD
ncbi:MAG: hypothetical protein JXQ90_15305 [Cyclobacteriaceae bacterium]